MSKIYLLACCSSSIHVQVRNFNFLNTMSAFVIESQQHNLVTNPCLDADPCGPYSICNCTGGIARCSCKPGHQGSPPTCEQQPSKYNRVFIGLNWSLSYLVLNELLLRDTTPIITLTRPAVPLQHQDSGAALLHPSDKLFCATLSGHWAAVCGHWYCR